MQEVSRSYDQADENARQVVRRTRNVTRRKYTPEEKVRIVIEGIRVEGMDPEELAAGQIPAALRTLIELELKVLGYEDRVALTGKDGGPVKTEHVFQPSKEVWDDVLRKRAEYERLRDGDTEEA